MDNDSQPRQQADDRLYDLLSEVWHADTLATNPRTREFLQAGEELLHSGLARDPGEQLSPGGARSRAPFDELLAWVSRRRVVDQAIRRHPKRKSGRPTESAYRYRWRTQTGYLRDLVIYALRPRMARPEETARAARVLFQDGPLDKAIDQIAYSEIANLSKDKPFRLQMVFQAILSHDARVADALRRIDETNLDARKAFYRHGLDHFGIKLRPDVDLDDFAQALQAASLGILFRSLLPVKGDSIPAALAIDHDEKTSRPLALTAMALIVAFADPGDGKPLRQLVRELAGPDRDQARR